LFENPTGILSLNNGVEFERICASLEGQGYQVWPLIIPACAVGAPHKRERVYILAHAPSNRQQGHLRKIGLQKIYDVSPKALVAWNESGSTFRDWKKLMAQSQLCRMAHGVSSTVDIRPRLHAYGNAAIPQVAYQLIKRMIEAESSR
jgi:DNA (cytosine-5)-methyltransferase 1